MRRMSPARCKRSSSESNPFAATIGGVRVRARACPIHRPAAPVRVVVTGLEAGTGPVRHLVAAEIGGLQLRAGGVELVPLKVGFNLGHLPVRAPTVEKCALLERKAVRGDVVRAEG